MSDESITAQLRVTIITREALAHPSLDITETLSIGAEPERIQDLPERVLLIAHNYGPSCVDLVNTSGVQRAHLLENQEYFQNAYDREPLLARLIC